MMTAVMSAMVAAVMSAMMTTMMTAVMAAVTATTVPVAIVSRCRRGRHGLHYGRDGSHDANCLQVVLQKRAAGDGCFRRQLLLCLYRFLSDFSHCLRLQ
jgi:hypothetical protein